MESLIVTMQDMTPLKEVERLRAEFLATVSHELRTPLATVRGSISALLEEPSGMHPAEIRQFYRIILEQTDRMRALIADLLDAARIETGTLPVSPEPTDLVILAGDAGNAFRIGGHRHNLRIDIPPDLPWIMADRSRIVQVLGNLLSNAARAFTGVVHHQCQRRTGRPAGLRVCHRRRHGHPRGKPAAPV